MLSLRVTLNDRVVFRSDGPWLYPLIELESHLTDHPIETSRAHLFDKVVGRASALLIVRLGFRDVETDLISDLAIEAFEHHQVSWTAANRTDRILCATESLLENTIDPEKAHALVMERAKRARAEAPGDSPLVSLHNVNVMLGRRHVLSAIDFEVQPEECVLITGQNGAGKSTLLRALLGLVPVTSGRLRMFGTEVGTAAWRAVRHQAAYVPQNPRPTTMPISVLEVLSVGLPPGAGSSREDRRDRCVSALSLLGSEHLVDRPFADLSGGEQRRVAIARALVQDARLLVFDEPAAGLDTATRERLHGLIEQLVGNRDVAVLMTTHHANEASFRSWTHVEMTNGTLTAARAVVRGD